MISTYVILMDSCMSLLFFIRQKCLENWIEKQSIANDKTIEKMEFEWTGCVNAETEIELRNHNQYTKYL